MNFFFVFLFVLIIIFFFCSFFLLRPRNIPGDSIQSWFFPFLLGMGGCLALKTMRWGLGFPSADFFSFSCRHSMSILLKLVLMAYRLSLMLIICSASAPLSSSMLSSAFPSRRGCCGGRSRRRSCACLFSHLLTPSLAVCWAPID